VKHLLIILISFLLLSYPVIGNNHKGETLYRWGDCDIKYEWDNSSLEILSSQYVCDYKWKGFGEKNTNPKFQGEVENGVPNGLGFMIFPNGDKYVGSWKDGERNGQGTYTNSYGYKFEGKWKDGYFWEGVSYDPNGDLYFIYENGEPQ